MLIGSGTNLTDSAELSGSHNGTGSITFYLFAPGVTPDGTNSNNVYSNTATVSGNGTYTTASGNNPGGYLPTVTGTYQWVVSYSGDSNNNGATSTFTTEPQFVGLAADLVLTKTVSQSQVFFGMNVTYTFIIRNLGPSTATNVVVTDPFPAGLVFVSAAVPSQGTYDPARSIWTVGTLANGAVATLHVTARVMTMGPIVNTARASAEEFDPVLFNNIASATVVGMNPASIISKRLFLAS